MRNLVITLCIASVVLFTLIYQVEGRGRGDCVNCGGSSASDSVEFVQSRPAPQAILVERISDTLSWWELPSYANVDNKNWFYLYENDTPIGSWDKIRQVWTPYESKFQRWGTETTKSPYTLPGMNFGVLRDNTERPKVMYKDVEITIDEANKLLTEKKNKTIGADIPDDSKKFRLTIIGSKDVRDNLKKVYSKLEGEYNGKIKYWYVGPEHWSLKDTEANKTIFKTAGNPTVYLQAPNGRVLHRQDDFKDETDLIAIRKAIKDYEFEKDPDNRKPLPLPLPKPNPLNPNPSPIGPDLWDMIKSVPMPLWILGGLGGFVWWKKRQEVVVPVK